MRQSNEAGRQLIRSFEGCKLQAYQDGGGKWTIGYGHTGPEVIKGLVYTQKQADEQLDKDLVSMCASVVSMVKVPITDNQFAALVSFAFNLGPGRLRNSTLLKLLNAGKYSEASNAILQWDKMMGQPVAGLTRRRKAERDLFNAA